jgi:hypothetical protein
MNPSAKVIDYLEWRSEGILYNTAHNKRWSPVHPVQESTEDTQTLWTSCTGQHRRYPNILNNLYKTVQNKISRHSEQPVQDNTEDTQTFWTARARQHRRYKDILNSLYKTTQKIRRYSEHSVQDKTGDYQTYILAPGGIRAHDPSVRAVHDFMHTRGFHLSMRDRRTVGSKPYCTVRVLCLCCNGPMFVLANCQSKTKNRRKCLHER